MKAYFSSIKSEGAPTKAAKRPRHEAVDDADEREGEKIVCCIVHGEISLEKLLVRVIDTKHFQRLRKLAQLGQLTWRAMLLSSLMAAGLCTSVAVPHEDWALWTVPDPNDPLVAFLGNAANIWQFQLTVTTFVMTLFLNEAWSFRGSIYQLVWAIQGSCQDLCLLVTVNAQRSADGASYTPAATALVQDVARYVRLSHTMFWASRGYGKQSYLVNQRQDEKETDQLLSKAAFVSPLGLNRLVARDELSPRELDALVRTGLPSDKYCYVLLEWVGLRVVAATAQGTVVGSAGFEQAVLAKLTSLRGEYFSIGDSLDFRMGMAYHVQFVQVLVDTLMLLTPFALYPKVGVFSIPLASLATYFFCGLLELSKTFFDIFGREGYYEETINVARCSSTRSTLRRVHAVGAGRGGGAREQRQVWVTDLHADLLVRAQ